MTNRVLIIALGAMLVSGRCRAGEGPKDKFAELEGTWAVVKMEVDGKSLLDKGEKWKNVIKDGKITSDARNAPKDAPGLAKILDPDKRPKTVTFTYEGNLAFYGIYEVDGDELRVCGEGLDTATEKDPESRRPKKFDSREGLLLVFKREK
jgi:uncharacterized protein (TIGR03067 family)